jgi:hypothetical protein
MEKEQGLSEATLIEQRGRYEELVGRFAPWWAEESRAIAEEIGVDAERFNAYQALREVDPGVLKEKMGIETGCTSFMAVGKAAPEGVSLFHKNRDYTVDVQTVFIKQIEGTYKYIASTDIPNIGVAYFLNDRGLAGASNTGSPTDDCAAEGFSEHHVMRLLAEKAASCEEALEMVREIVDRRNFVYNKSGVITLLVDKHKGLVIENTAHHLAYRWIEEETLVRANLFLLPRMKAWEAEMTAERSGNSTTRFERASHLLNESREELGALLFNEVSRDVGPEHPICKDSTVSAFTSVIPDEYEAALSYTWVSDGHPKHTYYIPLYLGMEGVPKFMVDGSLWKRAHILHEKGESCLEQGELETEFDQDREALERRAKAFLKEGRAEEARATLTRGCAGFARKAYERLAEEARKR